MSSPNADNVASQHRDAAVGVVRTLRDAGHAAYLAGGCVRDELLGLHPKDFDVATDATPDRISRLFDRTSEVGAAFGVVLVRHHSRHGPHFATEVATFRTDGVYSDGRRPDSVRFATAEEDAKRRDFTINALFLDPLAEDTEPAVIDFVGGRADLEAGVIRAVGDPNARLAEDHLRALRAVRFTCRLGFEIERETADAIAEHASELAGVSRERIGDEVRRMLAHPSRAAAIERLARLSLDRPVLDSARAGPGEHRRARALDPAVPSAAVLAAWALDRDEAPGVVQRWRVALNLTNAERDLLNATLHMRGELERNWASLPVARQKRLAASMGFAEALAIRESESHDQAGTIRARLEELGRIGGGLWPEPVLSGEDLIALGIEPGPRFKGLLDNVFDAQLEGRISTKAEAIGLIRELSAGPGV
ncbi:MAG: CCA tRNA nucleotidyltransferase [Planctomycetota bacterium]